MHPPIVLNRASEIPLHRQIYDTWRQGILAGRLTPGHRVPSTRELAAALSVARSTVTIAYDQLTAEGYLESERGSGTFVCRDLPDEPVMPAPLTDDEARGRRAVRLSAYAARLEPAFPRVPAVPGTIDLSKYSPDLNRFPFRVWRRLILRHLREATPVVFEYAEWGVGHEPLRRQVSRYLARSRAVRCTPQQVIVVSGSQQALDLCARILINPGDQVAVENPGYLGARQLFAAHGARLRPVPVDEHGLLVSDLPDEARVLHVTPSHQFPTGVSMALARRLELLEWARPRGAVIIEDDYDSEYRYRGAPLPALQGLSRTVPVIYVGSFSNVMFPGLRIGYVVLPQDLVEPFARAKWHSDRHTTLLEQAALADFLNQGHLERHIRRMRRLYARRREVLVEELQRHFGDQVAISGDAAGMYVLVRFMSAAIPSRAGKRGVVLASTGRYYLGGAPAHEYILRFSGITERAIREGVRRLAS
jgi:GntR family transcriptional regulator/MocR family aminotransferase